MFGIGTSSSSSCWEFGISSSSFSSVLSFALLCGNATLLARARLSSLGKALSQYVSLTTGSSTIPEDLFSLWPWVGWALRIDRVGEMCFPAAFNCCILSTAATPCDGFLRRNVTVTRTVETAMACVATRQIASSVPFTAPSTASIFLSSLQLPVHGQEDLYDLGVQFDRDFLHALTCAWAMHAKSHGEIGHQDHNDLIVNTHKHKHALPPPPHPHHQPRPYPTLH